MYCVKCGKSLQSDNNFCAYCGQKAEVDSEVAPRFFVEGRALPVRETARSRRGPLYRRPWFLPSALLAAVLLSLSLILVIATSSTSSASDKYPSGYNAEEVSFLTILDNEGVLVPGDDSTPGREVSMGAAVTEGHDFCSQLAEGGDAISIKASSGDVHADQVMFAATQEFCP